MIFIFHNFVRDRTKKSIIAVDTPINLAKTTNEFANTEDAHVISFLLHIDQICFLLFFSAFLCFCSFRRYARLVIVTPG